MPAGRRHQAAGNSGQLATPPLPTDPSPLLSHAASHPTVFAPSLVPLCPHRRPSSSPYQVFKFGVYLAVPIALSLVVTGNQDLLNKIIKSVRARWGGHAMHAASRLFAP